MRPSKSDTSLTESATITENDGAVDAKHKRSCANALREGFQWQRQLLFRSKLTMHTAYDRKDNAQPASITALAVSKYVQISKLLFLPSESRFQFSEIPFIAESTRLFTSGTRGGECFLGALRSNPAGPWQIIGLKTKEQMLASVAV